MVWIRINRRSALARSLLRYRVDFTMHNLFGNYCIMKAHLVLTRMSKAFGGCRYIHLTRFYLGKLHLTSHGGPGCFHTHPRHLSEIFGIQYFVSNSMHNEYSVIKRSLYISWLSTLPFINIHVRRDTSVRTQDILKLGSFDRHCRDRDLIPYSSKIKWNTQDLKITVS